MSLIRVQTVWSGVAGAPYYTNLYCIGPLSTGNGTVLHSAWNALLVSIATQLAAPMVATIDPELLEFDETTGNVTSAGTDVTSTINFGNTQDQLPHSTQALIQWTTGGLVHNRRVKGRTFIPGVTEQANSATGIPLPLIDTPLETAVATFLSTMSGRLRIWSRPFVQLDPAKAASNPSRPGSAHAVTSGAVAPYWAILRSRRD